MLFDLKGKNAVSCLITIERDEKRRRIGAGMAAFFVTAEFPMPFVTAEFPVPFPCSFQNRGI